MTKEIGCGELGIQGCNYTASGDTPEEVVRKMVEHLRSEHEIDMPDAGAILTDTVGDDPLEDVGKGAALIIQRMTEKLNIVPGIKSKPARPIIDKFPRK